jgi:hypothetical protein
MSHAAVFDSVRDRMLVFGGEGGGQVRGGLFALSLSGAPTWQPLAPEDAGPGRRTQVRMVLDPVDDAVLVYGGLGAGVYGDVWRMKLGGPPVWEQLQTAGTPPSPRFRAGVVLDRLRHRLLVFGGGGGTDAADLYELSLGETPTWTPLPDAGVSPEGAQVALYDPVRDRIVCAVTNAYYGAYAETGIWALPLSEPGGWTGLAGVDGLDPEVALAYDSRHDKLALDVGEWRYTGGPASVVWTSPLADPIAFTPRSGTFRSRHSLVYDPRDDSYLAYGGTQMEGGGAMRSTITQGSTLGTGWSPVSPGGVEFGEWNRHTTIYDPTPGRVVAFGGVMPSGYLDHGPTDEIGACASGGDAWFPLESPGFIEEGLEGHAAVYDEPRDRMIVFGGNSSYFLHVTHDTWAFDLAGGAGWSLLPAATPPPDRAYAMSFVDPVEERMLVFGGTPNSINQCATLDTVWALALAGDPAWQPLLPAGTPPPRSGRGLAVYDPVGRRGILFGGTSSSGPLAGPWELRLAGTPEWAPLAVLGTPPPAGVYAGDYDPYRQRVLVCGGADSTRTWALELTTPPQWRRLTTPGDPPLITDDHALVYDRGADRLVMVGGKGTRGIWTLTPVPSVVSAPPPAAPRLAFAATAARNPARELALLLRLPTSERVLVEVFDVAGRRVLRSDLGVLAAGRQRRVLDAGAPLGAGLFLARVRAGEAAAVVRFVRLR